MTQGIGPGLVVTTPSDLEVVATREFNAPRHFIFDAFTQCQHLKRWWGRRGDELIVCEIDLRPGGAWRFVSRLREGGEMGMKGEYREVSRPERLVQTEMFEGADFEQMGSGTLNTLVLNEQDGRTTMTITIEYSSREARDAALQTPMEAGMAESFDQLAELLKTLS